MVIFMDAITVAQGTFQAGTKMLNVLKLSQEISALRTSIYETYLDHSKAHFDSALEAIRSAEKSRNPETELRHAVHHLYDAFFALYGLLDKTVDRGFLRKKPCPYVDYQEDIYVPCCKIAGLAKRLYAFLNEAENAKEWNRRANEMRNNAKHIYQEMLRYHETLPCRGEDLTKFQGIEDVLMIRRRGMEISMRAQFSEELRRKEISEEQYTRLRRIKSSYAVHQMIPMPKPGGRGVNIEYYDFYFITASGNQYIEETIQALDRAIE